MATVMVRIDVAGERRQRAVRHAHRERGVCSNESGIESSRIFMAVFLTIRLSGPFATIARNLQWLWIFACTPTSTASASAPLNMRLPR